jgi:DNA-binding transcriptional MerR regulator
MLIGELAALTGVSAKALRFYEAEGLLAEPERTAGGYRDYPQDAVDRVGFVRQAQAAGLTLAQIGEILTIRDGGEPPCPHVAQLVDHRLVEVSRRLEELERTRTELLALRERVAALDVSDCGAGEICVAISSHATRGP